MASKSAHRLLATYNSSIDFRFCPLHSAIIFSRSSIDFSSAAIRASLGEKGKKEVSKTSTPGFSVVTHFLGLTQLLFNYPNGYLLSSFPTLPPVICFPAFPPVTCFQAPDNGFISPALRSDWLIAAQTDFAPYSTTLNDRFGIIVRKKAFSGITTCMYTSKTNKQTNKQKRAKTGQQH